MGDCVAYGPKPRTSCLVVRVDSAHYLPGDSTAIAPLTAFRVTALRYRARLVA